MQPVIEVRGQVLRPAPVEGFRMRVIAPQLLAESRQKFLMIWKPGQIVRPALRSLILDKFSAHVT